MPEGGSLHVFSIPLHIRFRGITVREGVLLEGAAGWGEWSPFLEYDARVAEPWLRCAEEAAVGPVIVATDSEAIAARSGLVSRKSSAKMSFITSAAEGSS